MICKRLELWKTLNEYAKNTHKKKKKHIFASELRILRLKFKMSKINQPRINSANKIWKVHFACMTEFLREILQVKMTYEHET